MFSKRLKEWVRCLRVENKIKLTTLLAGSVSVFAYWIMAKDFERWEWKRRYKACLKCPIYDPEYKRCRPFAGSNRGCGCYVPFSNLSYDECWGRETYGGSFGWSAFDPQSWLVRVRRK